MLAELAHYEMCEGRALSYLARTRLPALKAGLTALDSIVRSQADDEAVQKQCRQGDKGRERWRGD